MTCSFKAGILKLMSPARVPIFLFLLASLSLYARGNETQRPVPAASRIVSLSPSCTEIIFAIGADDALVGVTAFCDYPPEAAKKTKVGGFSGKSVSIESIVALKPDLVLLEGQMHQRLMDLLEKAGVRCRAVNAVHLADAYGIIREIGALTGFESTAAKTADRLRARIAAVETRLKQKKRWSIQRPNAFWIVWDDPLMTVGGTTFISEAIYAAGGKNIFADLTEQYPSISFESVLTRNPDWILTGADHGENTVLQSLKNRQGWGALSAVKNGKLAAVDADSINRIGPRLASAIEALARVFHPDAFE